MMSMPKGLHPFVRSLAAPAAVVTCAVMVVLLVFPGSSGAEPPEGEFRYELMRTKDFLFRLDSSTGQVWAVPLNGDGGWQPVGAVPSEGGEPSLVGRYNLTLASAGRRDGRQVSTLIRVDRAAGRAWVKTALPDGEWTQVGAGAPSGAPVP